MADGNDPGTTPPVPTNPFAGGGTEKNIDQQKALLNDLIAMQGQGARTLYERQGAEAQGLLNERLAQAGQVPDARKAVYDAFTRDAQAADQQHAQTVQRQAQLGQIFMDQAKGAVPIYAKNVDATTEAMRLQFEERRRKEEEARQAQMAASRASVARSAPKTIDQRIAEGEEDRAVKQGTARSILEKSGVPKSQWSTSDVIAAGVSGAKLGLEDAAKALGFGTTATALQGKEALGLAQGTIDELYNGDKDVNFEQVQVAIQALIDAGEISRNQAAIALVANAPRWGMGGDEYLSTAQRFMRGR